MSCQPRAGAIRTFELLWTRVGSEGCRVDGAHVYVGVEGHGRLEPEGPHGRMRVGDLLEALEGAEGAWVDDWDVDEGPGTALDDRLGASYCHRGVTKAELSPLQLRLGLWLERGRGGVNSMTGEDGQEREEGCGPHLEWYRVRSKWGGGGRPVLLTNEDNYETSLESSSGHCPNRQERSDDLVYGHIREALPLMVPKTSRAYPNIVAPPRCPPRPWLFLHDTRNAVGCSQ